MMIPEGELFPFFGKKERTKGELSSAEGKRMPLLLGEGS